MRIQLLYNAGRAVLVLVQNDLPHKVAQILGFQSRSIPRNIRSASSDLLDVLQYNALGQQIASAQTWSTQLGMMRTVYLNPLAIAKYEKLFWAGDGKLSESSTYHKVKDGLSLATFWSLDKVSKALSFLTSGVICNATTYYKEGLERWNIAAQRDVISNAGVFSQEGYYQYALEKVSEIRHEKAEIVHYQSLIRIIMADSNPLNRPIDIAIFDHLEALLELADRHLRGPENASIKASIVAWARWHRAAVYLSQYNTSEAIADLKAVAQGRSPYRAEAAKYLANHHFQQGNILKAEAWLKKAEDAEQQLFQVQTSDIVSPGLEWGMEQLMSDAQQPVGEEIVQYEPNGWGLAAGAAGLSFYAYGKFWEHVPPLVFDALYSDFIEPQTKGKENRKAEYDEALSHCFESLSTPIASDNQSEVIEARVDDNTQPNIESLLSTASSKNVWFSEASSNNEDNSPLLKMKNIFYGALNALKENWCGRFASKNVRVMLEKLLLSLSMKPQLQAHFSNDIFFLCFDIFATLETSKLEQFRKLINYLGSVLPRSQTLSGNLLSLMREYPTIQPSPLSSYSWLFKQFILPQYAELNETNIAAHLAKCFPKGKIKPESMFTFIKSKANDNRFLTKMEKFTLGIACTLLGCIKRSKRTQYFDWALTKFQVTPPLRHLCFAKLDWVRNDDIQQTESKWKLFNDIICQYGFEQTDFCRLLSLYEKLETLIDVTAKQLRETIRAMVADKSIDSKLKTCLLSQQTDHGAVQACLQKGADPNITICKVTEEKEYNVSGLWNKIKKHNWVIEYPIHVAIRNLDVRLVGMLIDYGSDLTTKNIFGLQPLQLLLRLYHQAEQGSGNHRKMLEIIKLIKDSGFEVESVPEDYFDQQPMLPRSMPGALRTELTRDLGRQLFDGDINILEAIRSAFTGVFQINHITGFIFH